MGKNFQISKLTERLSISSSVEGRKRIKIGNSEIEERAVLHTKETTLQLMQTVMDPANRNSRLRQP